MKIIGIIIVFITVSLLGIFAAQKQLSVLKSIKRTEGFIGKLLLCIKNKHMTIDEMFDFIKKDCDMSTEIFLNNISSKEIQNASSIAKKCGFSEDKTVLSIISEVFSVLGKYSADEQISEIELCRQKLLSLYEKNETDLKIKAKLAINSGFLLGSLAVILLW